MAENVERGRAGITAAMELLKEANTNKSMSMLPQIFTEYKRDELVNIYSKAPADERTKVYNLLQPIYPTDEQQLIKIKNGQEK